MKSPILCLVGAQVCGPGVAHPRRQHTSLEEMQHTPPLQNRASPTLPTQASWALRPAAPLTPPRPEKGHQASQQAQGPHHSGWQSPGFYSGQLLRANTHPVWGRKCTT